MDTLVKESLGIIGRALMRAAATRGYAQKQTIWRIARDNGFDVSHQTVHSYLSGKQKIPIEFLRVVGDALELTQEEKLEVAQAVSQDLRARIPELSGLAVAAKEIFDYTEEDAVQIYYRYTWGEPYYP